MSESIAALNAAIALKLGWKNQRGMWVSKEAQALEEAGNPPLDLGQISPRNFCEDIATIWEVVENLPPNVVFGLIKIGKQWLCQMGPEDGKRVEIIADTAPLAVCRAFLKLNL